jgi:hypothetical protein
MDKEDKKFTFINLFKKSLVASSLNILILFFTILLMVFVGDGNQWFVVLPLSIINSIIISYILKSSKNYLVATIFTIIISIVLYNIVSVISITINPIHNIILKFFEKVSFEHFLGNFIGIMVFLFFTLTITILILLFKYSSRR